MDTCIFCKIVEGEVPCYKVYEDEMFVAFLDIRPLSPGHTLLIPRQHYRWVWDVPSPGRYFEVARNIALAQQTAFGTEQIEARIKGEEVPHAHLWIYPSPTKAVGTKEAFEENAAKIRAAL